MNIHITSLFNKFTVIAILVALIGSAVQITPVYAASIVVNTNADKSAMDYNDGLCTLREAINSANLDAIAPVPGKPGDCAKGSGTDTITFAGNYTITLGSQLTFIISAITITGKGAANTIIQAAGSPNTVTWRLFQVTATGNLTLDGVTVQNGKCDNSCTTVGGVEANAGGGIHNSGILTVKNSTISGNRGTLGGGIYNIGTIIVENSTFAAENHAFQILSEEDGGGAIYNSGTMTVTNSTFSKNSADKNGGAIFNASSGTMNIINSIISLNQGQRGGGIFNNGTLTLTNSTIDQNKSEQTGNEGGGGIRNTGTLIVKDSTVTGNTATYGGGILDASCPTQDCPNDTTIENTTFSNNTASGQGGAIYGHSNSTVTVTDSSFLNNHTGGGGGAIHNFGAHLTVTGSTFSGNSSSSSGGDWGAGGIYGGNGGVITITNSTFTGNSASFNIGTRSSRAGALFSWNGTLRVTNSTISGNSSNGGGGGIRNDASTVLINTIVENNTGGDGNCSGMITNGGNNLQFGGTVANSCGAGIPTADPLLGPLANNGGHTKTMALQPGSPAIDAGNDVACAAAVGSPDYGAGGKDQRGGPRPQGSHCDIGAYESGAPVTFISGFSDVPDNYWALVFIERLFEAGITGGCTSSPLQYCPEGTVTRAQMAIFLERGIHGSSYNPPAVGGSTGFNDVSTSYWAGAWIKQLAADGITGGCGSGSYCPEGAVTRAQMAIFLLRSKYGAGYNPPDVGAGTGFSDVPPSYWAAAWIKQLVAEGITAGCGTGTYCPESSVTRAQMAVFLVRTFNLP